MQSIGYADHKKTSIRDLLKYALFSQESQRFPSGRARNLELIADFLGAEMRAGSKVAKLNLVPNLRNDSLDEGAGCHACKPKGGKAELSVTRHRHPTVYVTTCISRYG
ncbi:hypothetical protein BR1R5_22070 [Pseudomonas sp. BR1R-5]|nr:hypothetical protein BR1R5_22070 [Pseudomonas sp. BR1R-5]